MIQVVSADHARRTIDGLFEVARARIQRLEPSEAFAASERGALLVDIRSDLERERDGIVPGSLHVPRTVLEWRLDPESPWRNPYIGGLDEEVVLFCAEGYSSVLAAATLIDLGFPLAGDVIGGFSAWRAAGLPVGRLPLDRRVTSELPGMGPPGE
jgi:rhodanese-related sulfurtransferase